MTDKQLSFFNNTANTDSHPTLHFDGAARNNPGPAGAGIIFKKGNTVIGKHYFYLGKKTNNQAEYLALILGLILAKEYFKNQEALTIYSDSELLIQQMTGHYRVKNPTLQQLFNIVYLLSKDIKPTFNHVSRVHNKDADRLANQAIDTHNPIPEQYKRVLHEYHITL